MVAFGPGRLPFSLPPGQLAALIALFFLPAAAPSSLGWLTGFLAIPVFIPLAVHGYPQGLRLVAVSLAVAGIGSLLVQHSEMFIFALTLTPLGLTLFVSARANDPAATSGAKGLAVLAVTWLVFWALYGTLTGTNPYGLLLKMLDLGLDQTLEMAKSGEIELTPEMLLNLHETTAVMRETIPRMLPGLLAAMVVSTVWMNMVLINALTGQLTGTAPWGRYIAWSLPESLVWLPIASVAVMLFGMGWLQDAGGWLVMVSILLYFFQGLAVLIALLERWRVPPLMRLILYILVFLQAYNLVLLAVLGLIDVWGDFRKIKETNA